MGELFGIGVVLLLPATLLARERLPTARNLPTVALLGLLFFGLFPVLFNAALARTTAARGALALSTLPLLTMLAAAALGAERMTARKAAGVLVATAGVGLALLPGLGAAPREALAGDAIMLAAASCMALYNVWSRPLIRRAGPVRCRRKRPPNPAAQRTGADGHAWAAKGIRNATQEPPMDIQRVAAFSVGEAGGNPAGVVVLDALPDAAAMQAVAAEVGYSETAFAALEGDGWRVRYFAPRMEVPFCGHATIALGAVLARQVGAGVFNLRLNDASITVEGRREGAGYAAALLSPSASSKPVPQALVASALALFSYEGADLDPRLPPAIIEAGARHLLLALRDRARLRAMSYDLEAGRALMTGAGLVTIALVHAEAAGLFHARNAFAAGGLHEDPATGAAAAALAGYLRDLGWPHGGAIAIRQGEDMGTPCLLHAEIPAGKGGIRVSGTARFMDVW